MVIISIISGVAVEEALLDPMMISQQSVTVPKLCEHLAVYSLKVFSVQASSLSFHIKGLFLNILRIG